MFRQREAGTSFALADLFKHQKGGRWGSLRLIYPSTKRVEIGESSLLQMGPYCVHYDNETLAVITW
jgi:hypothetical protein